jgi:3-oxoacid CoA-transferase subunit A
MQPEAHVDKTFPDAEAALHDLFEGAILLAGGFGLSGNPENCIRAIAKRGTRGLTIVSNNCGVDGVGLGILLEAGQVQKMISSYVGENKTFERLYIDGKLEVELPWRQMLLEYFADGTPATEQGRAEAAWRSGHGHGTPAR